MTDDPDKKEFDVGAGVRHAQRGRESPSLYNLYMDFVMRVFKVKLEKKGYQRCSDEIQDSKSRYKPIREGEVP